MPSLDFLSVWHRTVARHAQSVLDGVDELRLSPQELGHADACKLGQWIAVRRSDLSGLPVFEELAVEHRTFHAVAAQLVADHLAGTSAPPDSPARERLRLASEAVTQKIDLLIAHMGQGALPALDPLGRFWDESLCVGIDLIDTQHAAIAELGARMARHPETSLGSEDGVAFLFDLHRLVAFHFETEEQLMQRLGLSASAQSAHIQEHTALLETIVSFSYEQSAGQAPRRVGEIMEDLRHILIGHVLDFDFGFKDAVGSMGSMG